MSGPDSGAVERSAIPAVVRPDRAVLIFISKDGVFVFARKGTRKHREYAKGLSFLPCASVDTIKEAKGLQVWNCRLSRVDNATYRLNSFDGTLDDLDRVGLELERQYRERKRKTPLQRARAEGVA